MRLLSTPCTTSTALLTFTSIKAYSFPLTAALQSSCFTLQLFESFLLHMMPRLHLIHVARIQVVSTCIHLYRLSPFTLYSVSATKLSQCSM